MDILVLVMGALSIVLSVAAIVASFISEKRNQEHYERTLEILQKNYDETQAMMLALYDKTRGSLDEINRKTDIVETILERNQERLVEAVTAVLLDSKGAGRSPNYDLVMEVHEAMKKGGQK